MCYCRRRLGPMCRQKPKSKRPKVSKAQRTFPSLYVNPSRQAASPSTTQLTGPDFKRCFCEDAVARCLCCCWGKRCSPSGSGEISELCEFRLCYFSPLSAIKAQSKNSGEDCDASANAMQSCTGSPCLAVDLSSLTLRPAESFRHSDSSANGYIPPLMR